MSDAKKETATILTKQRPSMEGREAGFVVAS